MARGDGRLHLVRTGSAQRERPVERREARVDENGGLVLLDDQDRSRWDEGEIAEGRELVEAALRRKAPGPYQLQAAIAACHTGSESDWPQIVLLYDELLRLQPSPVVELNRAVAVAMADGPDVGLALLAPLRASGSLDGYHLLAAAEADLLRRAGRNAEAVAAYDEALAQVRTEPERRFLTRRRAEVAAAG